MFPRFDRIWKYNWPSEIRIPERKRVKILLRIPGSIDRHFPILPPRLTFLRQASSHLVNLLRGRRRGRGGWKRSAGGLVGWGAVEVFPTQQRGNAETEEEISPGPLRPSNRGGGGNCVKVDVGYTRAAPSPPWNNKFSTARPVTKVRGPPLFLGPLTARHTRKTHPFPSPLPFLFITGQMYGRGYKFPNNSNIVCRRDTPSPHFRPAFLFFLSWK